MSVSPDPPSAAHLTSVQPLNASSNTRYLPLRSLHQLSYDVPNYGVHHLLFGVVTILPVTCPALYPSHAPALLQSSECGSSKSDAAPRHLGLSPIERSLCFSAFTEARWHAWPSPSLHLQPPLTSPSWPWALEYHPLRGFVLPSPALLDPRSSRRCTQIPPLPEGLPSPHPTSSTHWFLFSSQR